MPGESSEEKMDGQIVREEASCRGSESEHDGENPMFEENTEDFDYDEFEMRRYRNALALKVCLVMIWVVTPDAAPRVMTTFTSDDLAVLQKQRMPKLESPLSPTEKDSSVKNGAGSSIDLGPVCGSRDQDEQYKLETEVQVACGVTGLVRAVIAGGRDEWSELDFVDVLIESEGGGMQWVVSFCFLFFLCSCFVLRCGVSA